MANTFDFINAGYAVIDPENNENKLINFLKENYPSVISDNELKLDELKAILGLPVDEKVNGYGLNFVGRNFARAKYAQKTEKELQLNTTLSKDIDTTQNLVLKGDNLDSLKILKNHYSGKIKCIYIDPPYNTDKDEFVYPDKFDKEEAEVLGLANLSNSDFERLDFSFNSKKSHNGWLSFMYPRLLLARDLLSNDGVIFISIDDNEQANLKLLCDEVFGEENFLNNVSVKMKQTAGASGGGEDKKLKKNIEYVLIYTKNNDSINGFKKFHDVYDEEDLFEAIQTMEENDVSWKYTRIISGLENRVCVKDITDGSGETMKLYKHTNVIVKPIKEVAKSENISIEDVYRKYFYKIFRDTNSQSSIRTRVLESAEDLGEYVSIDYVPRSGKNKNKSTTVYYKGNNRDQIAWLSDIVVKKENKLIKLEKLGTYWDGFPLNNLTKEGDVKFSNGKKPLLLIKRIIELIGDDNMTILDFFAGSATTGHAVMQLNAEDGGNRKFIMCQIDEPIDKVKKKDAYDFCLANNLLPLISSITVERLKRAGEQIKASLNPSTGGTSQTLFSEAVPPSGVRGLDIGFKVFDSVESPELKVDETTKQISISENEVDALSRIYNMIFTVGLDEPTQVPETVVEDCIYKIGTNYYITNSEKINSEDFSNAIKNGKVFIDGWTASLNGTLQHYKEDVKIVF
ncbi:MAG: site-specific DNA-methyltransferase [Paludibacter sp.]